MSPDPEDFVEQQEIKDFTTTLANFYRGEVQRAYTWRTRLDRTTNWAILIMSALITWTFSTPNRPDELLLFTFLFLVMLLMIEARRYMTYNVWDSRIRVLEENFIAKILNPEEEVTSREWMKTLAKDLKHPHYKIPYWHAVSHRLRRVYLYLFTVLLTLWIGKLYMHPENATAISEILARAEFAVIPGLYVLAMIFILYISACIIGFSGPKFDIRKGKISADQDVIEEWEEKM